MMALSAVCKTSEKSVKNAVLFEKLVSSSARLGLERKFLLTH